MIQLIENLIKTGHKKEMMDFFWSILEKNKEKVAEKTEKPSNSSWKNEIVETLQKSKNMMNSFKFKN